MTLELFRQLTKAHSNVNGYRKDNMVQQTSEIYLIHPAAAAAARGGGHKPN
jgi:hypothetical protein